MADIVGNIRDFFQFITDKINLILEYLAQLLSVVMSVTGYIKLVFTVLPSYLYVFILILLSVCILYKVLGREGNS